MPLQKLGAGHYFAPLYDIPFSGEWQMTVRVQLGATDEAVLAEPVQRAADVPDVDVTTNFFLVLTLVADVVLVVAVGARAGRARVAAARDAVVSRGDGRRAAGGAARVDRRHGHDARAASTTRSTRASCPCELCWYQRILMYPLVIVLGVAWLRRDTKVWITALLFVVIGAPLSLYHWLVERVPAFAESSSCSIGAPCTAPWFEKLGFVTLAWMA